MADIERELAEIRDEARLVAAAADGRTTAGRRARATDRALTRLLEDLADLDADGEAS